MWQLWKILTVQTAMHITGTVRPLCCTGWVAKAKHELSEDQDSDEPWIVLLPSQSPRGGGLNRLPLFSRTFTSLLFRGLFGGRQCHYIKTTIWASQWFVYEHFQRLFPEPKQHQTESHSVSCCRSKWSQNWSSVYLLQIEITHNMSVLPCWRHIGAVAWRCRCSCYYRTNLLLSHKARQLVLIYWQKMRALKGGKDRNIQNVLNDVPLSQLSVFLGVWRRTWRITKMCGYLLKLIFILLDGNCQTWHWW